MHSGASTEPQTRVVGWPTAQPGAEAPPRRSVRAKQAGTLSLLFGESGSALAAAGGGAASGAGEEERVPRASSGGGSDADASAGSHDSGDNGSDLARSLPIFMLGGKRCAWAEQGVVPGSKGRAGARALSCCAAVGWDGPPRDWRAGRGVSRNNDLPFSEGLPPAPGSFSAPPAAAPDAAPAAQATLPVQPHRAGLARRRVVRGAVSPAQPSSLASPRLLGG